MYKRAAISIFASTFGVVTVVEVDEEEEEEE
jgi:hypothetical protein